MRGSNRIQYPETISRAHDKGLINALLRLLNAQIWILDLHPTVFHPGLFGSSSERSTCFGPKSCIYFIELTTLCIIV